MAALLSTSRAGNTVQTTAAYNWPTYGDPRMCPRPCAGVFLASSAVPVAVRPAIPKLATAALAALLVSHLPVATPYP
jgi:hypothetical protein